MIKDITIGQYYPVDSAIHRLDARTKLVGTIAYIAALLIFKNTISFLLIFMFLAMVVYVSAVPVKYMLRGMKSVVMLIVFTVLFNLLMTPGDAIIEYSFFKITKQGIENALFITIRLTFLIIGSSILTLTTTPGSLTDGLERLMLPLKAFKVPVQELSLMMSIALRFIPVLLEETDKIMKAQKSRGADFESGNIFQRTRAMLPILVPLFVSAFRRANDLALAMESRCYTGSENRTRMYPMRYKKGDFIAYAVISVFFAAVVWVTVAR